MSKSKALWLSALFVAGLLITLGLAASDDQTATAAGGKGKPKVKPVVAYVPMTGQTVSYAPGDDGDLQAGAQWPAPRFIDNGDGTITDRLTQLMWTQNADMIVTVTWAVGIQAANDLDFAGHDDWRMPNILELSSLWDWGTGVLPAGHPFVNWGGVKWTSTTFDRNPAQAWYWIFNTADINNTDKTNLSNVWPVRGPVPIAK